MKAQYPNQLDYNGMPNVKKESATSLEQNMLDTKSEELNSIARTRTRVSRVRAEYPDQLNYNGEQGRK